VGLSNVKYFSEASTAGERIMEVIKRVSKIDSDNMGGEILEEVRGEVEFENVSFVSPNRGSRSSPLRQRNRSRRSS